MMELAFGRERLHGDAIRIGGEALDAPAFPHIGTGFASVLQEHVVKPGTLHMEGFGFSMESTITENDVVCEGTIAQLEDRSHLSEEAALLKFVQDTHLAEKSMVVWEQRFTDMKAGKDFLFQGEHSLAGARQECGRTAASRPATNDNCIEFS